MRKHLPLIGSIGFVIGLLMLVFSDAGDLFTLNRGPAPTDPLKTKGNASATVTVIEMSDFQ